MQKPDSISNNYIPVDCGELTVSRKRSVVDSFPLHKFLIFHLQHDSSSFLVYSSYLATFVCLYAAACTYTISSSLNLYHTIDRCPVRLKWYVACEGTARHDVQVVGAGQERSFRYGIIGMRADTAPIDRADFTNQTYLIWHSLLGISRHGIVESGAAQYTRKHLIGPFC